MTRYNRSYLVENTTSDNRSRARRYMRDNSGMSKDESMQLDHQLQTQFKNVGGCECKFLLGLARMYMNGELEDNNIAQSVNQALAFATEEPYSSELNRDLNGMSAQEFVNAFQDKIEAAGNDDKDKLSRQDFGGNKGYDIVLIDSFEKAKEYAQYTDWCITQSETAYVNYTKGGTFYFCLRDGFEKVEKVAGPNAPLDEYGLSMIAVSIYPDGSCNTITCRWNHDNGGNDKVMKTEELSKVIGENFYDVFKPVKRTMMLGGKEYVIGFKDGDKQALFDEQGNNVLGEDVDYFNVDEKLSKFFGCDVLFVQRRFGKNFLKFQDGKVQNLLDKWVEWCSYDNGLSKQFGAPCIWVLNDQKGNYVIFKDDGIEYLFDEWFDLCDYDIDLSEYLSAPCFKIRNGEKCNYAILKDKKLQYLFDEWFDWCGYSNELSEQLGVQCFNIAIGEKHNLVILKDKKPQCLFDEWVDAWAYDRELSKQLVAPCFYVENEQEVNCVILKDGKPQYLFDEWFEWYEYDDELSEQLGVLCFEVANNGLYNCIKYQGGKTELLFNEWVELKDLGATKVEYFKQLEQRNENRVKHISRVITEMIIRKLR